MAASASPLLTLLFFSLFAASNAHNITDILSPFPEYSLYNSYLTQTKLADEINSRQTLTCLVLNNAAMSTLAGKHPLSVIKNALSILILLDYFDGTKLHKISEGTMTSATLYQTTGKAEGNLGFVNITDLKGGKVGFGSAAPGSKLDSSYTKSVQQVPYNISVLEISAPIIAPGMLTAPAPSASNVNITGLLEKAGCKTFASLILSSGVLKMYQSAMKNGLTLFAPSDEAFKAAGVPDLSKLTSAELVSLLQFHAIADYNPPGALKTAKGPINTMATSGAGKFALTATTAGDEVTLHTGVDSSRISGTVIDDTPLCILTVDSILLPSDLFAKSPAPAPAPAPAPIAVPVPSPSETPTVSPTPSPEKPESPSPSVSSPPAPAVDTGSPADSPSDSADSTSPSAAAGIKAPGVFNTLVGFFAVACSLAVASLSL